MTPLSEGKVFQTEVALSRGEEAGDVKCEG